ncbi:MAG: prolyl oligopeptidase family serine peptidase [Hyphomonadaceae bacterium]
MRRVVVWAALFVAFAMTFGATPAEAQGRHEYSFHELTLPNGAGRAWVYLPEESAGERLPVVLIGPAGSHLFDGMTLGDGDRPEHIPYARAGFAVVSFDIPGMPRSDADQEIIRAARAFKDGDGGVANARAALALALEQFPRLDANNVFTAGHSSAGTLSLTLCARLENLRGCVAYAPDVDLVATLDELAVILEPYVPGERAFIRSISPIEQVAQIRSPVMIFNAQDDGVVPVAAIATYVQRAEQAGVHVERVVVPRGGHYQSMIDRGVPAGIAWMRQQMEAAR